MLETYKTIFPWLPVPWPSPALLALLLFLASVTHLFIAALSAVERVLAPAPPVPNFLIADRAAAGTVRAFWSMTVESTLSMLVVERREAEVREERAVRSVSRKKDFILANTTMVLCFLALG